MPKTRDNEVLVDLISLVLPWPFGMRAKVAAVIDGWSDAQALEAETWAAASHVRASDHDDVSVPEEPAACFELRKQIQLWRGDNLENIDRMPAMPPRYSAE